MQAAPAADDTKPGKLKFARRKGDTVWKVLFHPALRIVIPILITALALYVLHRMSLDISLSEVKADARMYPLYILGLSFGAMCVSYLALSLYDFFILREVSDVPVPLPVTMMTGVSSMAVSNMLGFSWLTGGAIR